MDELPTSAPVAQPRRARRAHSYRIVALGLLVTFVLAGAVGAFIYFRYVRYERIAAYHVPAGTTAALRIDVEKVIFFEPVRAHLLPLADRIALPPTARPRLAAIKGRTGLELGVDLRELVLALGPTPGDWVIVVGGMFARSGVVAGIAEVIRAEGHAAQLEPDGVLVSQTGWALAQAEDGALALGTPERVRAARPRQDAYLGLGLLPTGPGSFAASRAALAPLTTGPARLVPGLRELAAIEHASGSFALEQDVTMTAELRVGAPSDATRTREGLASALAAGPSLLGLVAPELAAFVGALQRAQVAVAGPQLLSVRAAWTRAEIDRAMAVLASGLSRLANAPR
jgi:hypothetical protein